MKKRKKKSAIELIVKNFMAFVNDPKKTQKERIINVSIIAGIIIIIIFVLWQSGIVSRISCIGICFK